MTGRFEDCVSKLPDKQRCEANHHCLSQIKENENVAEDEYARTKEMKELVYQVAMRREMIVVLALHYLRIERLHRLGYLEQAARHFPNQESFHRFFHPWLLLRAQPPCVLFHFPSGIDQLGLQLSIVIFTEIETGKAAAGSDPA